MKYLLLLFISTAVFSQSPIIKIEIDSISSIDSLSYRKFTIDYSIRNISNNKISFFLNPERVIASSGGSMETSVSGSLFQEKEELPMHSILSYTSKSRELPEGFALIKDEKEKNRVLKKYLKDVLDIDIEDEIEEVKKNTDSIYRLKKSSERLMKSIMTLEPFDVKHYTKTFYWNKKRYHRVDEMEYYINENSKCFLLLYIVLLKEEYKERMIESDYKDLMKIPNFVKGWYTSGKVEINFSE